MYNSDFCTYDQALRLKKLEFDWETIGKYVDCPNDPTLFHGMLYQSWNLEKDEVLAPSLSHAQKWLREEHNLHIIVWPYNYNGSINNKYQFRMFEDVLNFDLSNPTCGFDTYEAALSAGLDAALKLLEEEL